MTAPHSTYPGDTGKPVDVEAALRERYGEQLSPAWFEARQVAREALAAAARPPSLADAAMSAIRGGTDAQRLVSTIRDGCAPADTLLDGVVQMLQLGDPERTRGFFRELQKRLERP